ncbi:glycosyltransferase family 4 protein [Candidatus Methylacidithermus pantelleriae]|uniref:Glycosyltransferase n=1 Tax=Candidatus Methylacidithermus pantelleriae TaxID=2744239 RepID=A0A8J2BKU8_9BACT|nr:glycosyltransferase family 4 protein [Candidatus Methylacidithermus pantelleriae]CAF0694449.1 Glycosyltransferase [Candidatus Methylacidithermus pantelleriae]
MPARCIRIAHLVSHPIQYFAPVYKEIANRREVELRVYFYSDASVTSCFDPGFCRKVKWDIPLLNGYAYRFSKYGYGKPPPDPFFEFPRWDVIRELQETSFDVVWIHGYTYVTHLLAGLLAWGRKRPVLLRMDSNLVDPRPPLVGWLKERVLPVFFRRCWGLYVGQLNKKYFLHYGVNKERLFAAPHCVDNEFFREQDQALGKSKKRWKQEFGITDGLPVILFCGKLVPKKDPLGLLEAYAKIKEKAWLLLVGDGPLRRAVTEYVRQNGLKRVVMVGFLNQKEIGKAYCIGDVLVLPSRWGETWGLVVNEAMNFGLPIIVTERVGCAPDLVLEGENGFVVPAGDPVFLAKAIDRVLGDPALRARMGEVSREIVNRYTPRVCADGIIKACLAAVGRKEKVAGEV